MHAFMLLHHHGILVDQVELGTAVYGKPTKSWSTIGVGNFLQLKYMGIKICGSIQIINDKAGMVDIKIKGLGLGRDTDHKKDQDQKSIHVFCRVLVFV